MRMNKPIPLQDAAREKITKAYDMDETACVEALLAQLQFDQAFESKIADKAKALIENVRKKELDKKGLEALMVHYDLSTHEGIMLMCLAEALLRVPDKANTDNLIRDKLTSAKWQDHLG